MHHKTFSLCFPSLAAALLLGPVAAPTVTAQTIATGPQSLAPAVAPPRADPARTPAAGYRLVSNDTIHIHVFQEDELETTARIGKDGSIPFPLVGSLSLGGRTVPEAATAVTQALKDYLVHPQVALRIVDYSKKRFTVLGQVNRPGTFDLPDESPLTLLECIGLAGGYNRIANPSKIIVKRRTPGGEEVFRLDAKQMAKGNKVPPFQIHPGDTVVVEESLF
jgi:polysaccharide export outer membrane protein